MTELQNSQQEKRNIRTAIVLASIAACFFLGFLLRRLLFQ
ncbi:MAG: cytochrome oxidase small assembly protein [Burkholderiales bacterium]